jgi:hypothetical protein
MLCISPIDDRIVLFGQSCVGKTTFAARLPSHAHVCFDALFPWHQIETLGLSTSAALDHVAAACVQERYVLDGWHLGGADGRLLPAGAAVYVVYAPYRQIIGQYRVPVGDHDEHRAMFDRWYRGVNYDELPGVRYILNAGEFVETTREEFVTFLSARSP